MEERFPCTDEHVPKESIVERINKKNREMWGPICKRCDLYAHFCRCGENSVFEDTINK